jgi:hypothetical protein
VVFKNELEIVPPPWKLKGYGYILLYHFNKDFIRKNGFLKAFQANNLTSGWGAVMVVNYEDSPAGPYQELLFIPGIFSFNGNKSFSISKIYVSTELSVVNGINNWGIPKEYASFSWAKLKNEDHIDVTLNEKKIFQAHFTKGGFRFPVSTKLIPFKIIQSFNNQLLLTKPSGKGSASFATHSQLQTNPPFFPDLSNSKPFLTIRVDNFEMVFPPAAIL